MASSFFGMRGVNLPFGMSNASNPNPNPSNNNPNNNSNNNNQGQPNPNNQQSQLQPKNPGADPNNQNNNTPNSQPNNNPNNNADPNKGEQGSQLDAFKEVFKLPVDDKGNPIVVSDPLARPVTNFNAQKFTEATKNANFAAGIPQETLAKAMSGQDPEAFLAVLNTVARNSFNAAATLNVSALETGFTNFRQNFEEGLPARVRNLQIQQAVPKHPALQHPAALPMVEALKSSISQANPTLNPDRIAEMAENYVIAMATDIHSVNTSQEKAANLKSQPKETNWLALLDPNAQNS